MTTTKTPEELLTMSRRLLAEVQALSGRISAVNEIAVAMNRTLDLKQILDIVSRQAKWMLDFDHCSVYLPHNIEQQFQVLFGSRDNVLGLLGAIPNEPLQRALATRQPQLLKKVEHGPFKSVMIMPLETENHVHGTLNFAMKREDGYSFDDMRIAYILALLLAAALRNATQFKEISHLYEQIQAEQAKAEKLLLNVLPQHVAEELKLLGHVKPTSFEAATVMFTDFVGFSHTTTQLEPQALIDHLDAYFSEFDKICSKWGLEKLKTIGDSYMCVSGIPLPHPDHALNTIRAAFDMREAAERIGIERDKSWQLRIGLHSGPLIAGVIGDQKFSYDVWGATVNLASRLESHSEPGQINISHATYMLLQDYIRVLPRGAFHVKNIGDVEMYFVEDLINIHVVSQ